MMIHRQIIFVSKNNPEEINLTGQSYFVNM